MITKSAPSMLGQGFYDYQTAARIVGVDTLKLKRWIGEAKHAESVFVPDSPVEETVTFMELMELMLIAMFRREGVSLQTIRNASQTASKRFKTHLPFAVKRFDTDGRTIFATLRKSESSPELVEDLERGQLVFEQIIKPFFRKLEYRNSGRHEALRYWPLEMSGGVVLDPTRQFGQPIDAVSGIPTSTLADAVKATGNEDVEEVANWFDIPVKAVLSAVEFEKSLVS